MGSIDPPRTDADRVAAPAPDRVPAEPPTARALWPTFMRRTLDEHFVGAAAEPARAG
jgi:hypothetical protein